MEENSLETTHRKLTDEWVREDDSSSDINKKNKTKNESEERQQKWYKKYVEEEITPKRVIEFISTPLSTFFSVRAFSYDDDDIAAHIQQNRKNGQSFIFHRNQYGGWREKWKLY